MNLKAEQHISAHSSLKLDYIVSFCVGRLGMLERRPLDSDKEYALYRDTERNGTAQ